MSDKNQYAIDAPALEPRGTVGRPSHQPILRCTFAGLTRTPEDTLNCILRAGLPGTLLVTVFLTACSKDSSGVTLSKAPAKIAVVSGDAQSAVGQAALSAPLVVKVTDPQDAPVANVPVSWAASDPTAQLSAATSTTDATGSAQVNWTLGQMLGTQTVAATASVISGAKAVFQATNAAPTISGGVTVNAAPPLSFVGTINASRRPPVPGASIAKAVRMQASKSRIAFAVAGAQSRRLIVPVQPRPDGVVGPCSRV